MTRMAPDEGEVPGCGVFRLSDGAVMVDLKWWVSFGVLWVAFKRRFLR